MQLICLMFIAVFFASIAASVLAIHYRLCELDKRQKEFINEFSNCIKKLNILNEGIEGIEEDFTIITANIHDINNKFDKLC